MGARWMVAGLLISGLAFAVDVPEPVRKLMGLAAGLPPEFQADAILQLVESRGGLDVAVKKEMLEQAIALARQARNAYPKVLAHGVNADSRQAFQANASGLKVDRLSLEMRAIRDLLAFDPAAARLLFQDVQKPAPATGTCADALLPQLDDYFDIGAMVVARGFTPKQIEREEHVALLLQMISGVKAPYEVGPAARMIANSRLMGRQFEVVLNAFTGRLEAVSRDDRAFSETIVGTQQEVAALPGNRATLARAYRKYLAAHYGGVHCIDSAHLNPVEWFNQSELRGELPVIDWKDGGTKDADGKMRVDAFWASADAARILAAAQDLRVSPTGSAYSAQERLSADWHQKLQNFMAQLSDWKQSGEESDIDFFHEKATVYESLIDVCPPGDGRQRLIHAFTGFLNGSDAANKNPVDWFWHAQNLYRRLRQAGDADATRLMAAYHASGNLMLEVYAQLSGQ